VTGPGLGNAAALAPVPGDARNGLPELLPYARDPDGHEAERAVAAWLDRHRQIIAARIWAGDPSPMIERP
jgi:hypothetical protein